MGVQFGTSTDSGGTPGYSIVPLPTVGYSWLQYCTASDSGGTPGYSIVHLLTVGVLLGTVLSLN